MTLNKSEIADELITLNQRYNERLAAYENLKANVELDPADAVMIASMAELEKRFRLLARLSALCANALTVYYREKEEVST